jgi:hypothetical protein
MPMPSSPALWRRVFSRGSSAVILNRSLVGSESKDEGMSAYIAAAGKIEEEFGCLSSITAVWMLPPQGSHVVDRRS